MAVESYIWNRSKRKGGRGTDLRQQDQADKKERREETERHASCFESFLHIFLYGSTCVDEVCCVWGTFDRDKS